MKLQLENRPIAKGKIDIDKFKQLVKTQTVFVAIRNSFAMTENNLFDGEEDFFRFIHAEIKWGLFYKLMNNHPEKKSMELEIYKCRYENMPVIMKDKVDLPNQAFEFKVLEKDGEEYIIVSKGMMLDKDSWLDSFISNRVFDCVHSEWDI